MKLSFRIGIGLLVLGLLGSAVGFSQLWGEEISGRKSPMMTLFSFSKNGGSS
jgi:hypothetical protein